MIWDVSILEPSYHSFVELNNVLSVIIIELVQVTVVAVNHSLVISEVMYLKCVLIHVECTLNVFRENLVLDLTSVFDVLFLLECSFHLGVNFRATLTRD